jgi:hypothetical protein
LIKSWPYPAGFDFAKEFTLEARALDDRFAVLVNGQEIGSVQDTTIADAGFIDLFATEGALLRKWEYQNLDASTTEATKADNASASESTSQPSQEKQAEHRTAESQKTNVASMGARASTSEPWRNVLLDPNELKMSTGMERTAGGLRLSEKCTSLLNGNQAPRRDGAIRMRAIFSGGLRLQLYSRSSSSGVYQLYAADEKNIFMNMWSNVTNHSTNLRTFHLPAPLQPGQEYELELRVVGPTLTAKFNGEDLGTFTDGTLLHGTYGIGASEANPTPTFVKSLEVLNLDAGK